MPSAVAPRDCARAPRLRAIGIRDETLAIAEEVEVAHQFAQFVVLQKKIRIFRMSDYRLIDEKGFRQQDPSWFERANEIRKQCAVEKIHIDNRVEAAFAKRQLIEVYQQRKYRKLLRPCEVREDGHCHFGKIRGD